MPMVDSPRNHVVPFTNHVMARSDLVAEHPTMSWSFYVNHYQNETQAKRDSKFAYRLPNGTLWSGLGQDPPEGAEP